MDTVEYLPPSQAKEAHPDTLVEFHLKEDGEMTTVKLKETGFAGLPGKDGPTMFRENTSGWKYMFNRLQEYLTQ